MDWEVIHGKYSFMKEIGRCCIVLHEYEYSYKAIFSLNLIQKSDYAFSRVFRNQKFEPIPSEQFEHTHSEYRMPWKRWNCMPGHHIFPHHFLWNLNCVVFAWACQTQSVLTGNAIHESYCFVQYFVLWYVIKAESDQRVLLFLLQSMKCASMCFTHDLSFISELIKLDQPQPQ